MWSTADLPPYVQYVPGTPHDCGRPDCTFAIGGADKPVEKA